MKWYKRSNQLYAYVRADSAVKEMREQGIQMPINYPVDIEFNKNKLIIKMSGVVLGEIQRSFVKELNRLQPFFDAAQIVSDDGDTEFTLRWILRSDAPITEIEAKDQILSEMKLKYQDRRLNENKRMKRLHYFTLSNVVLYLIACVFSLYGFFMFYTQHVYHYAFICLFVSGMAVYFTIVEFRKERLK